MTPVERAAEAMADDWNPDRDPVLSAMFRDYAQSAFRSIDVDELARVADAVFHEWWNDPDEPRFGPLYARAVIEHLLSEEKSNE